jgi:acetoacetyl-CoA synthetase
VDRIVWQPSAERIAGSRMVAFMGHVNDAWGMSIGDYPALYRFSIDQPEKFWSAIWDFCGVIGDRSSSRVVADVDRLPGAKWFPDARLNAAENLLRRRDEDEVALVFRCEDRPAESITFRQLAERVSRLSQALEGAGIRAGDRVAAYMPNITETIVAVLAVAKVGAIWSVCSTDLGVDAVVDRFGQIQPRVLILADGARYEGKEFDALKKGGDIARRLPSLERVVVVPYIQKTPKLDGIPHAVLLEEFIAPYRAVELRFQRFPFDHPLYILYSSGTTGRPKCIVHTAGGTLIQHMKEHQLHCDLRWGERLFRTTTSGWMLWNTLVSALGSGASIVVADGSPLYPKPDVLFDFVDEDCIHIAGIPPKVIEIVAKAGLRPAETHRLDTLKCILAGGARLAPDAYAFVYEHVKRDLHLTSPSGGTDIIAFFAGGNPIGPCRMGEIQVVALGMKVQIFDESGAPLTGRPGELVCTQSFPSIPLGFWSDPHNERFMKAYFDRWPNVWRHGDWAEITPHGGLIVHGRSDATLNARGVRIGTAEIYHQLEAIPEIVEGVAVSQEWGDDTRVVLFLLLHQGVRLDRKLKDRIARRLREHASPRHVPDLMVQVDDIPRTANGKVSELAVRDALHGREVRNRDSLANPASLDQFAAMRAVLSAQEPV